MVANCTIYKNIFSKDPFYLSVDECLERIRIGKSEKIVSDIRSNLDKDRQDELKKNLPSVCFSGKFKERKDELIIQHSGFLVLDFDNVFEVDKKKLELSKSPFAYACWISPRNNGLKLLVRIANGKKHREHFDALRELFTDADRSGVNEARVCYESHDPEIYLNKSSEVFTKIKIIERIVVSQNIDNEKKIFENITKWLSNRNDTFVTGERNIFIFKLASACCRFGLVEETCKTLITEAYEVGTNKFSQYECAKCIQSAYKSNKQLFGTAQFDKDILVDKTSRYEVVITQEMLDENIRPKDVIFGEDVKEEVFNIFNNGYQQVAGIGVKQIDDLFKFKEGEITLLSGYGNYGKSSFLNWFLLMRILIYGEKFAFFTPEETPTEFYHNLTEILLGCDCTPSNKYRPSKDEYEFAYDFISKYIFYVYPKQLSPTPEYIKERFLELIIKEKVKGVIIDPFNQLTNDYKGTGGRTDKYLETFLSDCTRFSQQNNIYFMIVAHPVKSRKDDKGNYPCPDVFDIADGAMWNNKMDNILIYDRPNHQVDPSSDVCQLHSKKIRRQKIVGRKGYESFSLNRSIRRFMFSMTDYMGIAISNSKFYNPSVTVVETKKEPVENKPFQIQPNLDFDKPTDINNDDPENCPF